MKDPFKNKKYKNGVEGLLSMYLETYQFVLGSDLEDYAKSNQVFSKEIPCNIYFVLKRPKVTFNPNSIYQIDNVFHIDFLVHNKTKIAKIGLGIELNDLKSDVKIFTEYPYNLFVIKDSKKTHLVARPSSLIDSEIVNNNIKTSILDYEILYIGQAYGKDGKRTAIDRLKKHETVQKIYTDTLTENPDSDIWFLLTHFSQVNFLISLGEDVVYKNNKKRDDFLVNHFIDNNGFKFTDKQRINFTEAGLIKLFEPKYNIEFKNNFPDKNHTSYSECYNLEIRGLNIELDTSEMKRRIYTKKTGRRVRYSKMYEFETTDDRISFLDALN